MKKLCSEYEAACLTGMSPELLRWLTSYAPKSGISRKLKVAEKRDGTYFYEQDELLGFSDWLKAPWPRKKDGTRPHVPEAIRREIINEANGECAICHGHKDTCEAAHLDPVHKSLNNHPDNLLWLCSNHHTAYDGGLFGPNRENAEFVINFKHVLHRYKLMLWRTQHEISQKLLTVLEDCDGLAKQLQKATSREQVKAIEKIAKATLETLPILAPVSKRDPKYNNYKSISKNIRSISKDTSSIAQRLEKVQGVRQEYITAYGFIPCLLCKGNGRYEGADCPVCNGDREIEEKTASRIDLSDFEIMDCPVCSGLGRVGGEDCPACGGDAHMEKRFAQRIDVLDYQKVECPLCTGSRRHKGNDCPVCGGEGELDKRLVSHVDLGEYEDVDCPLCEGKGHYVGEDCPECAGEGEMERKFAERVDLQRYAQVDCPLCKGKGSLYGNDCSFCHGEARINRRYLDNFDIRDYELVKCPVCKGKGHRGDNDCSACDGEGKMERRHAERI